MKQEKLFSTPLYHCFLPQFFKPLFRLLENPFCFPVDYAKSTHQISGNPMCALLNFFNKPTYSPADIPCPLREAHPKSPSAIPEW